MERSWEREQAPTWDDDKRRIVAGSTPGLFPDLAGLSPGAPVPGSWWRIVEDGKVTGYGWMDVTWGDAEVLLAVDPEARGHGVGSEILRHLEDEARHQGLRYLLNVIPTAHPDPEGLSAWLQGRGFTPSGADGTLLRRSVRTTPGR